MLHPRRLAATDFSGGRPWLKQARVHRADIELTYRLSPVRDRRPACRGPFQPHRCYHSPVLSSRDDHKPRGPVEPVRRVPPAPVVGERGVRGDNQGAAFVMLYLLMKIPHTQFGRADAELLLD